MDLFSPADAPAAVALRERSDIDDRYKWDLASIFPDWSAWDAAYAELDGRIDEFGRLQGTLSGGSARLLTALELRDAIGQLSYKVWYFASLRYDEDQRDNDINAKRQQVQILFAKAAQASPGSIPSCSASRCRQSSSGRRKRSWRSTGSPSRTSTVSRNTCWTTRASGCCRCPADFRRRPTTRMPRCPRPT